MAGSRADHRGRKVNSEMVAFDDVTIVSPFLSS